MSSLAGPLTTRHAASPRARVFGFPLTGRSGSLPCFVM